jgi:hypothetical protein
MKHLLFFLLFLLSCTAPPQPVQPAFFHWKNRLALTRPETGLLNNLGCQTLYIKFLDIAKDPDGTIRPYSLLAVDDTAGLAGRAIIPCVFITNSVFQDISEKKLDWLTQKTATALTNVGEQFPRQGFPEIQFDCDWTGSTRAAFFSFLKKIRPLLPPETRLSATIRLHQYKFPDRTGVPPADRGLLMFYNTGDIHDPDEPNSIFQPAAAEKYLHGAPPRYPLPLDVALPVFSWTLIYRDGDLWKIVPGVDSTQNSKPETQNSKLPYLRPDDLARFESVDTTLLRYAAALITEIHLAKDARVAFFYLDTSTAQRYPVGYLQSLCDTINSSR